MFESFLARQLAHPSGIFGRWFMASSLDRLNAPKNQFTLEQLQLRATDRVLEIGFGGGGLLRSMLEHSWAQIAGVDLSHDMVLRAKRRFRLVLRTGFSSGTGGLKRCTFPPHRSRRCAALSRFISGLIPLGCSRNASGCSNPGASWC